MALKARDLYIAAFIAFVAWGFLTSWAPIIRYLGYAFTAGILVALGSFTTVLVLSSKTKQDAHHYAARDLSMPAFIAPQAWQAETAFLSDQSLYKQETLHPSSFIISQSVDTLLDWILRDYVTVWYSQVTKSPSFVNEIDRAIRAALIELRKRILGQDVVEIAVSRVIPLITKHLKDFYEAERAVRGINLNRNVTESVELDLAIAAKYRDGQLHSAASLKHADLKLVQQEYLRLIVVRVLPYVLPERMLKSRTVSVLIKEIVSCAVLEPLMRMLADPDTWNQIMEAYGRTMIQDRKTVRKLRAALDQHASPTPRPPRPHAFLRLSSGDDERKFERFIRSIRQCQNLSEVRRFRSEVASQLKRESVTESQDQIYLRRLETGKQLLDQRVGKLSAVGNSSGSHMRQAENNIEQISKASNAALCDILYDATGLSYFMEYMDRRRRMTLVQFWIVVDGFRNPLEEEVHTEDPFATSQTRWTDADRMDLAQINEAYLARPELEVPQESRESVQAFLRAGTHATIAQFVRARAAVLKAQSAAYLEMDKEHFPDFKRSDLFYKYLTADDSSTKVSIKAPLRSLKEPSVDSIPESPSQPPPKSRLTSGLKQELSQLRRNAASNNDLRSSLMSSDGATEGRRSLDIDTSGPLFDDDLDDERLARSAHSLDSESMNGEQVSDNQDQVVHAMEAALTDIMTNESTGEDPRNALFEDPETNFLNTKIADSPRSSGELKRAETVISIEKGKYRPNLTSLGLVNTSSRIGVFTDNDLFGDEEKFLEDEQTDPEFSADEKPVDEEIHQAAPGDLGLAEAITALTADIDRLAAQDSVVDTLTRKAELTNNVAELRILGKSKSSLEREIRRKELQRQQYIVQESDNSLFGRANVNIKSIMVGKEDDGQEFALYVIEVQRKAGEHMSAASWAVARRYSEFHDLHHRLRQLYPAVRHLDFPRRRLVMKLQRDFVHKRRVSLEQYLRQLLQLPAVCRSRDLRSFLSQSAIVSINDSTRDGERRDIVSRIYNSVTDGMDEFLGNVPVLDQLSIAGQNLISAATSQFNTMTPATATNPNTGAAKSLPIAPEDPIQTVEARAELLAFEPDVINTTRADQLEPFVKPICDLFLETFDLQRGNNWLRGRAVVVVLHQLLGGTVERKVRESVRMLFAESAILKYIGMFKDAMWPDGQKRTETPVRTEVEKAQTRIEASVMLATLMPDLAGNVVGKANAQAASRRLTATVNNGRLNAHLAFVILDEVIEVIFPSQASRRS